jgi:sporulation protein YlmC with PRC-barrel domain
MDRENEDFNNPYTALEGYTVFDTAGEQIGRIEDTVYDEGADVLKYVIVDGRPVPAEDITVDAERDRVTIPFDPATVDSAPRLEHFSGAFDDAVREHYGDN